MFTGLIEGRGIIKERVSEGAAIRLIVEAPSEMVEHANTERPCELGESVAINGCCLTVIEIDGRNWSFQAGEETLSKTNLGALSPGDVVNLERALPAQGRLGGHFVQGHIDGVGQVDQIDQDDDWVTMWFRIPEALAKFLVPKGSVAVDGISLTVVDAETERFSVALIPHTLSVTTLGVRQVGDTVNIETDILGKYVQQFLTFQTEKDA